MRLRRAVAAGGVGLTLAACTGGTDQAAPASPTTGTTASARLSLAPPAVTSEPGAATTTPRPTPTATPPPRQVKSAELRRSLLRRGDLPRGFTLGLDPKGDIEDVLPYRSSTPACTRAVRALYGGRPPAWAGVRYVREYPTGRRQLLVVTEEIGSWPGDGAARSMSSSAQTPARCPRWNFVDPQYGTVRTRAVPLVYRGIGEQIAAYRLTTHWPGRGDTQEILVYARSDSRRLIVDYAVPVGRPLDRAQADRILAVALRRLPGWHRG